MQPLLSVIVTVYTVFANGTAIGFGIVGSLNVFVGDQRYVSPPEAFNMVLLPKQID